ncbi:MAG: zinc-binding dehydrogenase [Candidatus Marinimicrobia bacterium]|nr:zinc-binding dehydrogenase [Candidatus Neomarinimicrobiota bacterium]
MKAITIPKHGGREVLTIVDDYPIPSAGEGEVLVKVEATGLNRVDILVRQGYPGIEIELPHIPGGDIAGTVAETGSGVDSVDSSARVLVYPLVSCGECLLCLEGKRNLCLNWKYMGMHLKGGYAEYAVVPADNIVPIPDSVTYEDAIACSIAGLTAYHGIKTVGELKEGQSFFIWGGAGGLGTLAIQIAKHLGATVYATANSEEKLKIMRDLGVDYAFNRLEDDVPAQIRKTAPAGLDLIMDYVGPETFTTSWELLKKGGTMLLCGILTGRETNLNIQFTYLRHLSIKGTNLGTMEEMKELLALVADGKLKPYIGGTFPLEDAAKAQEMMEENRHIGKLILKP